LCLFKLSIVKDVGRNDLAALIDSSQEVAKKSLEKAAECVRCFEEDVAKARERAELQEFSLGSCPPNVGLQGMRWSTIGDQISDQSFDSRLRTVFDMVDKDADGRITEEEIKEIICLSATTNKLSNIQQQAKKYADLIMEELDPEETGFII
ncbi:hypothetical protein S83_063190, partial [Arachis hypogaea]